MIAAVALGPSGGKLPEVEFKPEYIFTSQDRSSRVHVGQESIALVVVQYTRFASFLERWEYVLRAAIKTLDLRRQIRVGLRYTNVVEGDEAEPLHGWKSRIAPHLLAAPLQVDSLLDATSFFSQGAVRFRTANGTYLFRHGVPPSPEEDLPAGYVLDMDAYDEEAKSIGVEDQLAKLTIWNDEIYRLLRTSVTDAAWKTFEPEGH
jgi:uncharacterized protein (TIGR04255 family)